MFDEVKGFAVTMKRFFRPNVTINYPEEKRLMAPRFSGLPSCLEMHVIPSEEGDRELGEFILRAGRCMFCGLCSQVCPVDAITMSDVYELSVMDRDGLIYTKIELASIGAQLPNWWEDGTGEFDGVPDAWAGTRAGKNLLRLP
jgi:NADH-quinone oxidoreductase subunit I